MYRERIPIGIALLFWGAVLPEERYLSEKFGAEYGAYHKQGAPLNLTGRGQASRSQLVRWAR